MPINRFFSQLHVIMIWWYFITLLERVHMNRQQISTEGDSVNSRYGMTESLLIIYTTVNSGNPGGYLSDKHSLKINLLIPPL